MFTRRSVLLGVAAVTSASAGCTEGGLEDVPVPGLEAEDRGEIVGTYDQGIGQLNDGHETRDEGIHAFNDERYEAAVEALDASIDYYTEATESFREAESMAEDAGVPPAAGICSEAATHATLMGQSTEEAHNAVTAATADESADVINDHIEASQDLQAEANESTVADPERLLETLEAQS